MYADDVNIKIPLFTRRVGPITNTDMLYVISKRQQHIACELFNDDRALVVGYNVCTMLQLKSY